MKEYIVALKDDVDLDSFWNEMETATNGLLHIPDRAVSIANNRTYLERICEYWLTDAEAEMLKNDPRVLAVEIPVRNNPNVSIVSHATQNIPGMNYTKQAGNISIDYTTGVNSFPSANYTPPLNASTNWGLIRHSFQNSPYTPSPSGNSATTTNVYNYVLDGSNVDIIINDSGIQADHPEFSGRVVYVDWDNIAVAVGAAVTTGWNTASYTDTNGHGTNVAGIAAGATYGWAKGANIIPLSYNHGDVLDMFAMLIYWHQNKGNNRPTIVNMSWGYNYVFGVSGTYYSVITGGKYRGDPILTGQSNSYYQQKGLIALSGQGLPNPYPETHYMPYQSDIVNIALGYVINSGIIVCRSAGNNGFKIDKPRADGGTGDHDNYVTLYDGYFFPLPTNVYYNKGSSPIDPKMISVGALDTKTSATGQDQRAQYSCAGPGVDIWAAGTYIMSAGCTNPANTSDQYGHDHSYYLNPDFKEFVDTGTSQASPQITGIASLYLQANPPANIYDPNNCSTVKTWLLNNSTGNTFYSSGNSISYTNALSLLGGEPRVAYQAIQGLTQIKNPQGQWRPVKDIQVKNNYGNWQPVKTVWVKEGNTWKPAYTKSS